MKTSFMHGDEFGEIIREIARKAEINTFKVMSEVLKKAQETIPVLLEHSVNKIADLEMKEEEAQQKEV